MPGTRVLVGTRKGAFVLTSDEARTDWKVDGPHFAGMEIYHLKGSPLNPDRIYASQSSGWFGQVIHRSDDGGATWETVGNDFTYDGVPGQHQWYDGSLRDWAFTRVWHLEPSVHDAETVYAGVEDAALFKSTDGGASCTRSFSTRATPTASTSRSRPRVRSAPATAGRPGSRSTRGCAPVRSLTRTPRSATVCTASTCTRPTPTCSTCRSTGTSCAARTVATRGKRSAATCRPTSASRSPCTPMSPRPSPWSPSSATRTTTRRTGSCASTAVDQHASCGVYFGTTGGQVYASNDSGDSWAPIVRDLPAVLSVEVQTLR